MSKYYVIMSCIIYAIAFIISYPIAYPISLIFYKKKNSILSDANYLSMFFACYSKLCLLDYPLIMCGVKIKHD